MVKDMLEDFVGTLVPASYDRELARERRDRIADALKVSSLEAGYLFESGSWSHGTAIRGKSDVDFMAWASGTRPTLSSSALRRAKEIIRAADWRIHEVSVSSPVVAVRYGTMPHFEIVPAWWHSKSGQYNVFTIPGRMDEWVLSCPAAHLDYVNRQNNRLAKKVKPLIRLLKAWKQHVGAPISSFYLEMRTAEHCAAEKSLYYYIDLPSVMRSIIRMEARDMNDPQRIVGRIPACASDDKRRTSLRLLRSAVQSLELASDAMKAGDKSEYWKAMYDVYGVDFPYPTW